MFSFKDFIRQKKETEQQQSNPESLPAEFNNPNNPANQLNQIQQGSPSQVLINPFAQSPYANINLPDQPLQYGGSMAESMLSNDEVPKAIRDKHWYIFHKDNVLTFLDEERKRIKMLNFDILKIDMLNAMPYYDYNFEKEMEFTVLRGVIDTKFDRALGTKNQIKNERTVLQSQFTEARQISEMDGSDVRSGFLKRLLGRR